MKEYILYDKATEQVVKCLNGKTAFFKSKKEAKIIKKLRLNDTLIIYKKVK